MTRDHHNQPAGLGARAAAPVGRAAWARVGDPSRAYPLRQFVAYRSLIEKGERRDPEGVVVDFIRSNPSTDLEAPLTFAAWRARSMDDSTAQRPRVHLGP